MSLQDKIVVITGGAGGIGRVASSIFADKGARVIILDYNREAGVKAEAEIAAAGGRAQLVFAKAPF